MQVKRIKLHVEEPGGIDRRAWPITQGVPFAEGDLERGAPVQVVTAEGERLPTQATCLTTWRADLRYVKWLLLDFQLDLAAGQTREIFLEYGPDVQPAPPPRPVVVEEADARVRIDTGTMQLELRRGDPDFWAACRVKGSGGWRDLLRGRPGPYLYMVDQRGTFYGSYGAAPAPLITVEDVGSLRTSVCIKGFHASEDGRRFCPYVLRLHCYAGRSDIRGYHTLVFDQDPERTELRAVGLRFPLDLGEGVQMGFGGEDGTHWARRFRTAELLQI